MNSVLFVCGVPVCGDDGAFRVSPGNFRRLQLMLEPFEAPRLIAVHSSNAGDDWMPLPPSVDVELVAEDFHPAGSRGTPRRRLLELLAIPGIAWRYRRAASKAEALGVVWLFEPLSLAGILLAMVYRSRPLLVSIIGSPAASFSRRAARSVSRSVAATYSILSVAASLVERAMVHRAELVLVAGNGHVERLGAGFAFSTAGFTESDITVREDTFTSPAARWVYAGTVCASKGVDTMLEALRAVRDEGFDHRAVLVGPVDCGFPLQRLVRDLGLEGLVDVRGQRPWAETLAEMRAGDVFVFLSLHEGMPKAPLEAMSQGLPVVATATGAEQFVVDRLNGLLVPPSDSAACASAVKLLARDEELRRRIIRGALRTAASHSYEGTRRSVHKKIRETFAGARSTTEWRCPS